MKTILLPSLFFFFFFLACSNSIDQAAFRISVTDWQIVSSDSVPYSGEEIASSKINAGGWFGAHVPSTVLGALVAGGKFENSYYGKNLENVPPAMFQKSWWYRAVFDLPELQRLSRNILRFSGINYRADVWLNGKKIAGRDSVYGAFRVFEFNISHLVREKNNVLAVQVFPPQPGDFTIGFVDWNPAPPDKNMGLWRKVEIVRSGGVRLKDPFVRAELNESFDQADLIIMVRAQNLTSAKLSGVLTGRIEDIQFKKTVELLPGSDKLIKLTAKDFPQLSIKHPRLWWPHTMGKPELYSLDLRFEINGNIFDQQQVTFGIRKVEDYFTEEGYRGYKINGQKVLIQGGGWTDDLMLADSPKKIRAQLQYVKHMNLNTIRLEGFWGKDQTIYNMCDSLGVLIMAGWSCQWEWESYLGKACDRFGGVKSKADMALVSAYWRDQLTMFRNHPSIFVWLGGSDMLPRPELEKMYLQILEEIDGTRPYLGAAAHAVSEVSGPTGVKMNGPYDYVPPKYWYEDTMYGGAYGFNTETGPGPQPPPLSSIKKMIPESHLWPIDDMWEYHCGRNKFNTLKRYLMALVNRYGQPSDLVDFDKKAQIMNYEAMRPMFESFAVNKFKATGVIQWMLNSAWPEMYWQLYDYYLMPNGAFYGAKKACAPKQLIYNYKDHSVYLNNNQLSPQNGLKAKIRVFDMDSKMVLKNEIETSISGNSVKKIYSLQPQDINLPLYFLDLRLSNQEGREIASNFYWLSQKEDVLDYPGSTWFVTPVKQYADFKALSRLPWATIQAKFELSENHGSRQMTVHLNNPTEHLAFFIQLEIQNKQGEPILPVFWEDNYISLLPGESRTVRADFQTIEQPRLIITGWNTPTEWITN